MRECERVREREGRVLVRQRGKIFSFVGRLDFTLSDLSKSGASFLPFALSAPQILVIHPVDFAALFGVSTRSPDGRRFDWWRRRWRRWGRLMLLLLLLVLETQEAVGHGGRGCHGQAWTRAK